MAYQLPVKFKTHVHILENNKQVFSTWDSVEVTGFKATHLTQLKNFHTQGNSANASSLGKHMKTHCVHSVWTFSLWDKNF